MVLFFNPPITETTWPHIVQMLEKLHTNIVWRSGHRLGELKNHRIEDDPIQYGSTQVLEIEDDYGGWRMGCNNEIHSMDAFLRHKINDPHFDGWNYLGLDLDTASLFNSLDESIKRNIKQQLNFPK